MQYTKKSCQAGDTMWQARTYYFNSSSSDPVEQSCIRSNPEGAEYLSIASLHLSQRNTTNFEVIMLTLHLVATLAVGTFALLEAHHARTLATTEINCTVPCSIPHVVKTELILEQFEGLEYGVPVDEDNSPCGPHFDGLVGLNPTDSLQFLQINGEGAAILAAGNAIRTDLTSLSIRSMDPKSVHVGCYTGRGLREPLGSAPSGLPFIGPLVEFLVGLVAAQSGLAINSAACDIIVKVTRMAARNGKTGEARVQALKETGADVKPCPFNPSAVPLLGISFVPTAVQRCDLSDDLWKGVTAINFTVVPKGLSTGSMGVGSTLGLIDDFVAIGEKR